MHRHAALDTAEGIAQTINAALAPLFQGYKFKAYAQSILSSNSVSADFYQVEPNAGRLDTLNAPVSVRVFITSQEGKQTSWPVGGPTPALIMAETLTAYPRTTPKLRAIKGPPEKVVKSVIDFFRKNADALKSPSAKLASSLSRIVTAHQAKQAATQISPKKLYPEAAGVLSMIKQFGLKLARAWSGVNGQILEFKKGSLKSTDLLKILQDDNVRWIAFDESDAEQMGLQAVAGTFAGEWRFYREDFSKLNTHLRDNPSVLKYQGEFSVGC